MTTLTRLFLTIVTALRDGADRLFARPQLAVARTRRGAGLVEYMLLGALAVLLFIVIRAALSGAFDDVLDNIREALTGN